MNEELKKEIKELMIKELAIEDITADEIKDDEPILGEGLGLDSIDALELGVAIQKKYGVKLKGRSDEEIRTYFSSVNALTDFIDNNR